MNETLPYIAIAFSGLTLVVLVAEKLFGGGNALANKFHELAKETSTAVAELRREFSVKVDSYEGQATLGFDATRANIHAMQIGLLEFRAKVSEDLHMYIRKDDYNAGIGDLKRDLQAGFRSVDERMGQLQDLILYQNPEAANGKTAPHHR